MSVLVVAEHIRGELRPVTLELISAAKSLGGPVAVAVIAKDPGRTHRRRQRRGRGRDPHRPGRAGRVRERRLPGGRGAADRRAEPGRDPARVHRQLRWATGPRSPPSSGSASPPTSSPSARRTAGSSPSAPSTAPRSTPSWSSPGTTSVVLLLRPTVLAARRGRRLCLRDRSRGAGGNLARAAQGLGRGTGRRRRHHDRRLPPLGRTRHRRQGEPRAVRGARRVDGRDALRRRGRSWTPAGCRAPARSASPARP